MAPPVCLSVCAVPRAGEVAGTWWKCITGTRHRKRESEAALTHGCLYQNGCLNSGSENKPVLMNRDSCLVLKLRWVGSRSQSWHGFLSLLSPSFSRFPLEHPALSGWCWEHNSVRCSSPGLSLFLLLLGFGLCQQSSGKLCCLRSC